MTIDTRTQKFILRHSRGVYSMDSNPVHQIPTDRDSSFIALG